MFTIFNTLSGKKELFKPLEPQKIKMYVCGITPYDEAHIGHGRSYVIFDSLYRWLTFLGYDITYARNFTDIDDKLLAKAEKKFGDQERFKEVADMYIQQFERESKALNCLRPTYEPRVTENIPQIIAFIQKLIDTGHAYESDGDVYFAVHTFPEYGKLSKQKIEELKVGTRKDIDPRKKDPLDFALWKKEKDGTFYESPWGYGRPGWHIECSALASEYLGDQIDIHGGGRDLVFPHHENEVAQSEAHTGKQFAHYWIHNGLINLNKQKMSKSIGNILSLRELCDEYDPIALRFYYLTHHYRSPLDFSFEDLASAQKTYKRLVTLFNEVPVGSFSKEDLMAMPVIKSMLEFLLDDLNTPGMFGVLFEHLDTLKSDPKQLSAAKQILSNILGLSLVPIQEKMVEITPEIQALIDERTKARSQKDWKRADEIRDQLIALGVEVQDKK